MAGNGFLRVFYVVVIEVTRKTMAEMVENGRKWQKMGCRGYLVGNGRKWPKMAGNGFPRENDRKWIFGVFCVIPLLLEVEDSYENIRNTALYIYR